ncbi:MAG: SDR family NAD(P)-dependent oxidoreductase [Leifsonia sp.]
MDPSGKVAIVTGGGAGLGRELAVGLTSAGAHVVVADVDLDAAAETAETAELVAAGGATGGRHSGTAWPVRADVRDPAMAFG